MGSSIQNDQRRIPRLELAGIVQAADRLTGVQCNAASVQDFTCLITKPIVIIGKLNGVPVRVLFDSGSLGDFVSTTISDQLKLKPVDLRTPISLHLMVQGSRSKINIGAKAQIEYQEVNETCYFDVINLSNYNVILGTPFMFQHQVTIGLNPA